jgi:hypothetical protein
LDDRGYDSTSFRRETVTVAMRDGVAKARSGWNDDALGGTGKQQI